MSLPSFDSSDMESLLLQFGRHIFSSFKTAKPNKPKVINFQPPSLWSFHKLRLHFLAFFDHLRTLVCRFHFTISITSFSHQKNLKTKSW